MMSRNVTFIHCIGVKGIGLSALAQMLARRGYRVTGSDIADPFPADTALHRAGIRVFHDLTTPTLPKRCDLVIASSAYLPTQKYPTLHPKLQEAKRRNIPVQSYPEAVAELFHHASHGIAIAGTHGKSTISALLAVTLETLRRDPDAIVGAVVKNWGTNFRSSRNDAELPKGSRRGTTRSLFVLEADEYRGAFHHYRPFGAIVTSVDWDHPDVFPTPASYRAAFRKFVARVRPQGFLVLNGDAAAVRALRRSARTPNVLTYGFREHNDVRIRNVQHNMNGLTFSLSLRGKYLGRFRVALYGNHNAANAAAVVTACLLLGETPAAIRRALPVFRGTVRRFDILTLPNAKRTRQRTNGRHDGERRKANNRSDTPRAPARVPIIIDDYAHHPAEIRATITTARAVFPQRRIRILFQPHTYSRTAALFPHFLSALRLADEYGLLQTYASARETIGKERNRSTSVDIAKALRALHFDHHDAAFTYYRRTLRSGDVLLVVGAGDGNLLAKRLANVAKARKLR